MRLSRRGLIGAAAVFAFATAIAPGLALAREEKVMAPSAGSLKGQFFSMDELRKHALIGLQHTEPAGGWTQIAFPNHDVHAISANNPDGVSIGYDRLMELAVIGLTRVDSRFAGHSLKEAGWDGYGMIGAVVV